ncbi:restriction endonuclease [Mesorhizobium caraganae]|uniref:restriction endonuclease n=1 Tax=Mesorhizobium caraganae TaxID=483206 RepID=UPI001939ECF2|nr:restriction endonuclease [Mesorhizobium caraganae]MBM2716162.1 restriction endonuclease [Mesorhizobium caraganae]
MAIQRSDLPFGSEFSPSQIHLPELLEIVNRHQGDFHALEAEVMATYFSKHSAQPEPDQDGEYNRGKLANNCKLGMIAYGLIDRQARFTPFGQELFDLRGDEQALYEALAKHILLNLKGMTLVQCLQDMVAAGEEITLDTLRHSLEERGVLFPRGGKHPSMMRLWLAKAGVIVGNRWQVNTIRLRAVLGTDPEDYPTLAKFTPQQRAFLLALANTGIAEPQPANEIVKLASATYGVRFPDKSLPKDVLNALSAAGYIEATKTTTGRGAKPFLVAPTAKVDAEIIGPLLDQLKDQVDPKLLSLLTKPLAEILEEIKSEDRYVSGLGLEALAFKLMRNLAMDYVATRLRASATGGAEVDLIFQSARLVYSRWQVQCKNTARVALDDVAKEVGLTHFLKSTVIVIVTTGEIGSEARRYANKIMSDSNLAIVMIDRADLEAVTASPAYLIDAFRREAEYAMALKKIDLGAV